MYSPLTEGRAADDGYQAMLPCLRLRERTSSTTMPRQRLTLREKTSDDHQS